MLILTLWPGATRDLLIRICSLYEMAETPCYIFGWSTSKTCLPKKQNSNPYKVVSAPENKMEMQVSF